MSRPFLFPTRLNHLIQKIIASKVQRVGQPHIAQENVHVAIATISSSNASADRAESRMLPLRRYKQIRKSLVDGADSSFQGPCSDFAIISTFMICFIYRINFCNAKKYVLNVSLRTQMLRVISESSSTEVIRCADSSGLSQRVPTHHQTDQQSRPNCFG